jgi:tight adherence protein B
VKRLAATAAAVAIALIGTAAASASASAPALTQVGRLPFPDRGFVVDVPGGRAVSAADVHVTENGRPVRNLLVTRLSSAGISYGVVLAVDSSDSMAGRPLRSAVGAARVFVSKLDGHEQLGLITFNGGVHVLARPTSNGSHLDAALARVPKTAYGTRIYDALARSLELLKSARLATGSIVLLSDGTDIGSATGIRSVIATAQQRGVRIFTIGLRSGAFDPTALERLAHASGGVYAEATSARQLGAIYASLQRRLASEYLVRYRSNEAPSTDVQVSVTLGRATPLTAHYTAPTLSRIAPYHRSFASRFFLAPAAILVFALLGAAAVGFVILLMARPRGTSVVTRVNDFVGRTGWVQQTTEAVAQGVARSRQRSTSGWLGRIDTALEVARVEMSALRLVALTLGGTVLAVVVLATISPVFGVLGLFVPMVVHALVKRKLNAVRSVFADQLAPNLQVLASAMRVGHSFIGAMTVVVDNASEPSKSELQRVVADERLGVPVEVAIGRVAKRMVSRDLDQVALLAELQRTAGGNAAEVLDTVVGTLRERADLRRLMRTLTAQGRMARWILTALPIVVGVGMFLLQPSIMRPLYTTHGGQLLLTAACGMVVSGSLLIQRIIEIKV